MHWYLITTDAGPNEMGARRITHSDVSGMPNVLYTDTTCLEHAQHLVLKSADKCLKQVRDWKYYGSLATCCNVLRDVGQQLFATWAELHGFDSAKESCKSLWPKACSGRWSGCEKPEARFLECGQARLLPVVTKVLDKSRAKKQKKQSAANSSVDELAIEENKAYSEKMTRWKVRTLQCLEDQLWWKAVRVMHTTRAPLTHLSNFLHQKQGQWRHVAQLTTGKAMAIFEEFSDVLPTLIRHGCLSGTGSNDQFARNFAPLSHHVKRHCDNTTTII